MLHYFALWLLVRLGGRFPRRTIDAAADFFGTVAWYASPRVRRVTRDHMRHVLGLLATPSERDRAARGCVRSAARYYGDFARGPYLSLAQQFEAIEGIEGIDHFFRAYDRGCGVILLSAHLGNPEFIAHAVAAMDLSLLVLTEPLSPLRLEALVHSVRATPAARFFPAGIAGARAALEHLRAGGVLGVLGDRDVLGNGRPTVFFGEQARLPAGPVELALRTGAPIVVAFVLRTSHGRLHIAMLPAVNLLRSGNRDEDVRQGLQMVAAALEMGIRRAPNQWFPLSPVWGGLTR